MTRRSVYLPEQPKISEHVLNNWIRQLRRPAISASGDVEPFVSGRIRGQLVTIGNDKTLVVPRSAQAPETVTEMLISPTEQIPIDSSDYYENKVPLRWAVPALEKMDGQTEESWAARCKLVLASWKGQFFFKEEHQENGTVQKGLRSPQMGAVYAALAHWKVTIDPATIVMPTGTGKTETMIALLVKERLPRLLVIVPTDALREQITAKIQSLGVLKSFGVVGSVLYPVVCSLKHRPPTPHAVETIFKKCNVVVSTMAVAGGCIDEVQKAMADICTHLFIDEAHHIAAPTWEKFRQFFIGKPILQFTATPFRNDRRHIDGKIIFNYPLGKAQEEGYFKPINFRGIREPDPHSGDMRIASVAVEQLETDLAAGFDHVVMARTSSITRARLIHNLYCERASAHNPLLIHSEQTESEKREAIRLLRERRTRIIVCIDMLGEGFDLPELKIAALHDMHKSLAITLQFTGRFTRTKARLGEATVIANIANADVGKSLRELYADSPDWNVLLRDLSEGATGERARQSEFLSSFSRLPTEVPLQNITPKMSTVAFRTSCEMWQPDKIREVIPENRIHLEPTVSPSYNVAIFVTRELEPVPWGTVRDIQNTTWHMYLLYWDRERGLLFINSSNNDSAHEDLAKAVAGDTAILVKGEIVYRCFHGVHRLILLNLGLSHSISRAVRFTMYAGSDLHLGLSEAQVQNRIKTNLFGIGYEDGERASYGCAQKGRIWSHRVALDISAWMEWCRSIGAKLLDESISVSEVLENAMVPEVISQRPALVPLAIEWPDAFFRRSEEAVFIEIGEERTPFFDCGLELTNNSLSDPIRFRVFTDGGHAEYEVQFSANGVVYSPVDQQIARIVTGRKNLDLSQWFKLEPPIIRYEQNAFSFDNLLYRIRAGGYVAFNKDRIETWDWSTTDIKKESQTILKLPDSIQRRVIDEMLHSDLAYDIVFDDDDSYEVADVVAIKLTQDRLTVDLFHCKYSQKNTPGGRVGDLYAVCGQAQRSAHWKVNVDRLFRHLKNRDRSRDAKHKTSRFERGNLTLLSQIAMKSETVPSVFRIFIVQPGLSKNSASADQLALLASTEVYLKETCEAPLEVIASA
jgi:superfamily II DNA or RNA helicase